MKYSKNEFLMWTNITISVISDTNPLEDIHNSFGLIYSLEKEFSRFSNLSDLSLLNKEKELELSNRFIKIFNIVKTIYKETDGYFNPLMNLKNIWYAEDFRKWIFDKKDELQDIDIEKISVNQNKIKLWKNQNIDLWWIVKWYAVDLVSEYLKEKWYIDFIINAWGDIFISWKNKNGDVPVVAIDSPFNKKKILAVLEVTNKAISTSWTYKRKWNVENENFHHILNPKTNSNNNEIISISLVSDKCYIADAYATACIAMWIEKSLVFLKKQNIDWIIIWTDGNTYETKWLKDYNLEII